MVESRGASRDHQRDKMGAFHLWGYYNNHPVYQHYSGLDFLYFHKNQVGFILDVFLSLTTVYLNLSLFKVLYSLV